MINKIIMFVCLPWREQGLFLRTFGLTGIVRLAILLLPFRWLALILGKHMQESPLKEDPVMLESAKKISKIVERVSRYTPWESKCLVQAITGKILLRNQRLSNTLYLGVAKGQNQMIAHAWLRAGRFAVTGGCGKGYAVVAKFADVQEDS